MSGPASAAWPALPVDEWAATRGLQIDFDFIAHQLVIAVSTGALQKIELQARPVAEFFADEMSMLDELGLSTPIWTMPVEIPDAIPFELDDVHSSYDRGQVERFWRALVEMTRRTAART